MHTLRKKSTTTAKELKLRKKEQIEEFFALVDAGKILDYSRETAFVDYLASIRSKSGRVQKHLKTEGPDYLEFKIFCPMPFFGALVSQLTFNRDSDITFRYYIHFIKHRKLIKRRK